MKKLLWLLVALGGVALLNKRRTELGSWSAAAESVKTDFAGGLAERNNPNAPSIWSRLMGSKAKTEP